MDGKALVFTLQASDIFGDLSDLYVAEVKLNSSALSAEEKPSTPTVCSPIAFGGVFNESNRQYRLFYCVRPRTLDYPSNSDSFDPSNHFYYSGVPNSDSFGYAYAYGEGQFYYKTHHASRGTCGIFFTNITSDDDYSDGVYTQTLEDKIDLLETEVFSCIQEGAIIGETSGQKVIVDRSQFNLSGVYIDAEAFMDLSFYNKTDIPGYEYTTTTMEPPIFTTFSTTNQDTDAGNMLVHLFVPQFVLMCSLIAGVFQIFCVNLQE